MKIKNWLTCVQDRAKWKDVVEKAKLKEVQRLKKKKKEEEEEKEKKEEKEKEEEEEKKKNKKKKDGVSDVEEISALKNETCMH